MFKKKMNASSCIIHFRYRLCLLKRSFWSVFRVYPVQFSLQITVIWENIKSEYFREIIPLFEQVKLPVLEALYPYSMSKHFNIHWPFKVCSSSCFRKLLQLCNTLYYILPSVLVIHVNHVHCTLFFLLSVSKLYSEILQHFNHLRKKLKICQLFGKKNKKMFSSYFFLSISSNFSFIWSMEDWSCYWEGCHWGILAILSTKMFYYFRWTQVKETLLRLGYAKLTAHQLICDLEKSLLVTTHCFFDEKNMCVTFAVCISQRGHASLYIWQHLGEMIHFKAIP